MNVLVTGSSGLIGSYIVKRFIEAGHTLRTLDRLAQPRGQDWEHLPGDIRDLALVRRAAQGMDAIVHLAAIPNDFSGLPEDVLDTNIHGTWNVLLAAFEVGIKRVVYFSSINALGHAEPTHPAMYLPMDDDVPHHPAHPYFLTKHIGEELCQSYVTLSGGTAISLRPTYVMRPPGEETDPWWNFVPVEQRLEMMKDDYWTFVDVRDVAEAALLSLTADLEGHHAFLLTADNIWPEIPAADLIRRFWPERPWPKVSMDEYFKDNPHRSLVDCSRAKQMLGWQPKYNQR
ncbi:MAG: NAD(P)-dependent oxidoreductase [Anaerolineaceae bacterium]|nr:NAD(P)-dependent oxidoreductase [Anaerolineaceae bacterium]